MPTALSITQQISTAGGHGVSTPRRETVDVEAGNGGVSKNELILKRTESRVRPGMYVLGLGCDGDTSTHGITVERVQGSTVVLSSAIAVADDTLLTFEKNTSNIKAFEFSVSAVSGKSLNWASAGKTQPTAANVVGFVNVSTLINGATSSSTTVTLDSTAGIVPGMTVFGGDDSGLVGDVTVSTVASATQITVSSSQSLKDDGRLNFGEANEIDVLDIQATEDGRNVKIQGLLRVKRLQSTSDAYINLDDFITVL